MRRWDWKRWARGDRGVIFLETALVLPIYFTFMVFITDIPRFMTTRQRLSSANRLVADVRAHDDGYLLVLPWTLKGYLFEAANPVQLTVEDMADKNSYFREHGKISGSLGSILGAIGNIFTMGTFNAFYDDIVDKDKYYVGYVTAKTPTIFPPDAYKGLIGARAVSANEADGAPHIGAPYACYIPNTDSAQQVRDTFTQIIRKYIPIL